MRLKFLKVSVSFKGKCQKSQPSLDFASDLSGKSGLDCQLVGQALGRIISLEHQKIPGFQTRHSGPFSVCSVLMKVCIIKAMVFPVVMYGCESWTIKKAKKLMLLNCGAGEGSWESLGDCREIQPVHPKGSQPWMFIGRIDGEAKAPILWPPDAKSRLIWKDPDISTTGGRNPSEEME